MTTTKRGHVTPTKGGDDQPVDTPDEERAPSTQGKEKLGSDERARLT